MNFLLRDLKAAGTMVHDCIAFNDDKHVKNMMEKFPGRAVMHMGDGVTPGPFWAVHASDVKTLVAAGYILRVPATAVTTTESTT
jgi:hypothetical protein